MALKPLFNIVCPDGCTITKSPFNDGKSLCRAFNDDELINMFGQKPNSNADAKETLTWCNSVLKKYTIELELALLIKEHNISFKGGLEATDDFIESRKRYINNLLRVKRYAENALKEYNYLSLHQMLDQVESNNKIDAEVKKDS